MKNLKSYLSAVVVLGLSTSLFASPEAPAAPALSTKPAVETAKAMAQAETLTGKVATINAETRTLNLSHSMKGADGKEATKEVSVVWAETTKLAWKNEKMTAATTTDLKAGTEVTVKAENKDGKLVATEIWLHTPAAAAAAQPATK